MKANVENSKQILAAAMDLMDSMLALDSLMLNDEAQEIISAAIGNNSWVDGITIDDE